MRLDFFKQTPKPILLTGLPTVPKPAKKPRAAHCRIFRNGVLNEGSNLCIGGSRSSRTRKRSQPVELPGQVLCDV